MRIVCPFCSAAYDVPEALLAGRQAVRCARCAREWQPALAAPAPAPVPAQALVTRPDAPPPPALRPMPETRRPVAGGDWAIDRLMAAPQPRPPGRRVLAAAWAASVVIVLGLLAGAYVWRADIMAAWPPSTRLYAVFGLADGAR